jgi:transposase-like protein
MVHFYRNVFSHVPATRVREVSHMLKAIHAHIRRRTRVVGAFPDGQSCLNLAAARLRYIAGTAWSTKRYMNMRPLYQSQVNQPGAAVA